VKFSKNQQTVLCLVAVFLVSFLVVFFAILFTQFAYSTPNQYGSIISGMEIVLGPPPHATNVPLDTTITVDALASASLTDLHLTPNVNFASTNSQTTGPLTYQTTFYPQTLLQPNTTYTASVTITNTPITWVFTTTPQPYQPTTSYYLATNNPWIALTAAASATAIVGFAAWIKRKRVR